MKQTGDLSYVSLTSEMAVSLVQSQNATAASGATKRQADDMLLGDNHLKLPAIAPPMVFSAHSPLVPPPSMSYSSSHSPVAPQSTSYSSAHSPMSILTQSNQSPYKLPESYLSPISLENTSPIDPRQSHGHSPGSRSTGKDSGHDNLGRDLSSDDEMPSLKRVRLETDGDRSKKNNNTHTSMKKPEKSFEMSPINMAFLSPKPHQWSPGNASSPRVSSDSGDNPPGLTPIPGLMPHSHRSAGLLPFPLSLRSPPHPSPFSLGGALSCPPPLSLASSFISAPLSLASSLSSPMLSSMSMGAPLCSPAPLVIKPLLMARGSPSRSSDGEVSMGENTDPNATPSEEEGHEVCPECQKVFKRKIYLQRHLEREHWSTAKVFKCEDCNYETKHQSNLSVHRRTHTGERPYHCGACGQRYTQGHLLKSHIRSRHHGNMALYNLDKKSESTRGRKSLDAKHEIGLPPPPPGGVMGGRQDKISTLLAQAAKSPLALPSGMKFLPPPPPPGSGLSNYMNALSSLYSMQQSPALRNLMPSTLLGGGLLPPRSFFPGAAAVSGMLPNFPQSMPIFSSPSIKTGLPVKQEPFSPEAGLKWLHQGLNFSTGSSLNLSPSSRTGRTPPPQPPRAATGEPHAVAQDLSLKPPAATPPPPSPASHSAALSRQPEAPASLVISSMPHSPKEYPPFKPSIAIQPSENSISFNGIRPDLAEEMSQQGSCSGKDHDAESPMDASEENTQASVASALEDMEGSEAGRAANRRASRTSSVESCGSEGEAVVEWRGAVACVGGEDGECGGRCSHLHQLERLRATVLQMLRCLAPELSDKPHVDLRTHEVDDLLHDVMFSSIEQLTNNNIPAKH